MNTDLSSALEQSITEESKNVASMIVQLGIDAIDKDGALQGIPIVGAVASVFKIGHNIIELHYLKKLAQFVFTLNFDVEDEKQRQYYISKLQSNKEQANKEVEYILVLLGRYIQYSKADMLAKLYLAYLRKEITWDTFAVFSEVIDRLLPGDYEVLKKLCGKQPIQNGINGEAFLRLSAVGMVYEYQNNSPFDVVSSGDNQYIFMGSGSMERTMNNERVYKRTSSGDELVRIIEK